VNFAPHFAHSHIPMLSFLTLILWQYGHLYVALDSFSTLYSFSFTVLPYLTPNLFALPNVFFSAIFIAPFVIKYGATRTFRQGSFLFGPLFLNRDRSVPNRKG